MITIKVYFMIFLPYKRRLDWRLTMTGYCRQWIEITYFKINRL